MNSARTLARTPAYWAMVLVSAVSALLGVWLIVDKLPALEAGLEDQTATTALVYGGQSWVVVGAALLGAGILGLVLALGAAALRSASRPAVAAEPVEVVAGSDIDAPLLDATEPAAHGAPAPAAAPAAGTGAQPLVAFGTEPVDPDPTATPPTALRS